LILIGTRHEEAVNAEIAEGVAQSGDTLAAELRGGGDVERLKHGLIRD
jgi:hypothetical protein